MSQDSCDDEQADSPPTTVGKPNDHRATNTTKCWYWNRPTTWNWSVVFNGMLAVTTAFLAYLAYYQLESAHVEQRAWISMKEMKMVVFKEGSSAASSCLIGACSMPVPYTKA